MLQEVHLEQQAVRVRRAYKAYGSGGDRQVVLDNLNMTVLKGSIYGLLGPSGCGKTTLLSCIVGRKHIQSGEIYALGGHPGSKGSGIPGPRVGYMPQEVALYGEFTIWETLRYFGWVNGMTAKDVEKRADFLLDLMQLPNRHAYVKYLSGGQQRRVSMVATFIHQPELLILDEPTVGLDPVLRERIWEHLVEITTLNKTTIIITTHYIDETKQANKIGMMRKGKLLIEESPLGLLQNFGLNSLEEVFLKLSYDQNVSRHSNNERPVVTPTQPEVEEMEVKEEKTDIWKDITMLIKPHHIKALVWKNALWMIRNYGMVLFIFFLPLIEMFLFYNAVGTDPKGLKLAVLNRESPENILCSYNSSCDLKMLSCRFLRHLNKRNHELVPYQDYDKAIEAVRRGWAWAFIDFPERFSDNLADRFEYGKMANETTLEESEIGIHMDMSDQQLAYIIRRDLILSLKDLATDVTQACDLTEGVLMSPVHFKKPIYGSNLPNFNSFMAPGVLLTIAFFLSVLTTSGSMLFERNEGIFERCLVTGITVFEILSSLIITQLAMLIGVCLMMIMLSVYVFHVENCGNVFLIYILTLMSGICGMSYGFVISCVCSVERTAMYVSMGSFLPFIELCGVMWPIEGMHASLKPITYFLPLTYPTNSMRAMMGRGWDMTQSTVYLGFVSNIVWTLIFLSTSILILKFKKA
ncbi:ABC transporter G family member 20-like [Cimex lectularius]|uniref:ABC Transporter n=1 Tax=Cimex lectularius TaxID=79782 RepID=A0A8I6RYV8_CIMLE|nr:ABC transporter G family member 20-like [Cimex lectularius]